jgi:RNA polymerase sigma-70 factor (ECF subfamily)
VLVARLAAGDDEALAEVLDRYGGVVLGIARRVSGRRDVAEEVVQDVLTALWREPARFDPARGTLRAYLGVQAHRRAVDAVRTDVRRRAREDRYDLFERRTGCSDFAEDASEAEAIRAAIARLPDAQRAAVELAYWGGRTTREVAVELDIPEGTAKSRLRLAQQKLAEWLQPLAAEAR